MSKQSYDSSVLRTTTESYLYHLIERHGPVTLSMLRSLYQNSDLFDVLDSASSERKFLVALEQLKNYGRIVISGAIPCDQAVISLA